jgi:hypothetical protein
MDRAIRDVQDTRIVRDEQDGNLLLAGQFAQSISG